MSEQHSSHRWQDILADNPEAAEGMFNPARKDLLAPGVFIELSPLTAASWMPSIREQLKGMDIPTHIPVSDETRARMEELGSVRVEIVEVGDDDTILIEARGVRDRINASVFYNSIKGQDRCPTVLYSNGLSFGGWAPPDDFRGNVG